MSPGAVLLAFAAGTLSFATPCVLPLVPGYLAAIGGVDPDALARDEPFDARRALRAALPFVAGFSLVFVLLGAAAGGVGGALSAYRPELIRGAGIVVVAMGFATAGLLPAPFLERTLQPGVPAARRNGSALLLGAAFALCWTPCVGPVLFSILALASSGGNAGESAALLAVYALGLAVPFLAVAVAFGRTLRTFRWLRDRYSALRVASGAILVTLGLLVFFDRLWVFNVYANRALSALGLDGLPTL